MTETSEFRVRLDQILTDAPGVLDDLKRQRDAIDIEVKRVERLVSAMTTTKAKRKSPRKTAKKTYPRSPTTEVVEFTKSVAQAILTIDLDEFTVDDIAAVVAPGKAKGQTAQAFRRMRSTQFIGKVGLSADHKQLWKILDTAAAESYTMAGTEA